MTDGFLRSYWHSLPQALQQKLLVGCTGRKQLLETAGMCLRVQEPALDALAASLLQCAFAENPLDGAMAQQLLAEPRVCAVLPEETLQALGGVAERWQLPKSTSYYERLRGKRDFSKMRQFIESESAKEPANLYWREQALIVGVMDRDMAWVETMLAPVIALTDVVALAPVCAALEIFLDRLRGVSVDGAMLDEKVHGAFGPGYPWLTAGLSLLQKNSGKQEREAALSFLLQALRHTPWNTNLLLRTFDLAHGVDVERHELPGHVVILLYSWNKDVELDSTLGHLYAANLGSARLIVLDNGSTDRSAEVLESWQLRFGERMELITLPVNIGAPAARNWLMHLPSVRSSDFVVYLDDDVELPKDWLQTLGAAVKQYPHAGVWGCKVVDHAQPLFMQHADGQLLVLDNSSATTSSLAPNPFKLSDLHIQSIDSGLFDYMRPCASVTGCCHLFRTARLLEVGDFSIHLSPSQYDDFEHDIRSCEAGAFPVYTGHLRVLHKKRTGAASRLSLQEEGNALGNKYKMQAMHGRADLEKAQEQGYALLEQDLLRKMAALEQHLE